MITIDTENYNLISQDFYNKVINSIDLNQISCPCGHSGCLIFYGSYKRKVQLPDKVLSLTVSRVFCSICGHTHALLLSSIVPYSQIPLSVHADILAAFEESASTVSILENHEFIDESNLRYIIRIFKQHWSQRLLSEGISFMSLSRLVRECFLRYSRQFMQIKNTPNKLFLAPT